MRSWVAAVILPLASCSDNGRAGTPPQGWRSWVRPLRPSPPTPFPHSRPAGGARQNQYQARIDQAAMEANFRALAQPRAGGLSLAALGYTDAGLDDGWQLCNQHATPANPHAYHTPSGAPVVDTEIFPDFAAMNRLAHSLNLTSGWCKSERALFPRSLSLTR